MNLRHLPPRAFAAGLGVLVALGAAGCAHDVTGTAEQSVDDGSALDLDRARSYPGCAAPRADGGDWATYGGDLANTRSQPAERSIGRSNVALLAPVWSFYDGTPSGSLNGGLPDFNSTPLESAGCVYAANAAGNLYALNAETGALAWTHHVATTSSGLGGAVVGAPALSADYVYVLVNESGNAAAGRGPYLRALDRATGDVAWQSAPISTHDGAYSNSTPIRYKDVIIVGFSGAEGNVDEHGGFVVFDARTGATLKLTYSIPESDWAAGYAGADIWSTAAVDVETGFAFVGTGNPFSKHIEHPNANAILKIDLNRKSRRFGEIVGSLKGEIDQYSEAIRAASTPTCTAAGDVSLSSTGQAIVKNAPQLGRFQAFYGNSQACVQLDLDFGGSVNLFKDAQGNKRFGDLQKSGIYHAGDADTMSPAFKTVLGVPCQLCNGGTSAVDENGIVAINTPGVAVSFSKTDGSYEWASAVADVVHYQATSVANGVAYTIDGNGGLDAFDTSTGAPLLHRPMAMDIGTDAPGLGSSGVAIARHAIYVAVGSHVVAYRPGGAAKAVTPSVPPVEHP